MKHGAFSVEAAFAMNQLSIALRRDGRIEPALILAQEALRVDQAHRDPDAPELPHRRCNSAVLLTMRSELSDACDMLASAWERRIVDRDITAVRILIVRRFVASIRSEPLGTYMGRIRDLLEQGITNNVGTISAFRDFRPVIDFCESWVPADELTLFEDLLTVVNGTSDASIFKSREEWKGFPAVPASEFRFE